MLGDDALKDFVLKDLEASGIECHAIIDPDAADHAKKRVHHQRLPDAQGGQARQSPHLGTE